MTVFCGLNIQKFKRRKVFFYRKKWNFLKIFSMYVYHYLAEVLLLLVQPRYGMRAFIPLVLTYRLGVIEWQGSLFPRGGRVRGGEWVESMQ